MIFNTQIQGSGGGSSASGFLVIETLTSTSSSATYTLDRTAEEIIEALQAGLSPVLCRYDGSYLGFKSYAYKSSRYTFSWGISGNYDYKSITTSGYPSYSVATGGGDN